MSESEPIETSKVEPERLARHREWERLMQTEVARALDEHRRAGHPIAVMRNNKAVLLQTTNVTSSQATVAEA